MRLSAALPILGLTLALAIGPSPLAGQRACPPGPFPTMTSAGTRPIVLVARLSGVILDRARNDGAAGETRLRSVLTYQSLAELEGRRDDPYHDVYTDPPEPGGLAWTAGNLYLLVLVPLTDLPPDSREMYWTAPCFGSREVTSVAEARQVLAAARAR